MSGPVDSPRPLGEGDAGLDPERLAAWLTDELGQDVDVLEAERFARGFSNLTYLVRAAGREMVLRRPPVGVKIASAHDMAREFRIVQAVGRVWDKVPRAVALCEDDAVLGAPFYLMERVRGIILRDRVPEGLALGEADFAALSRNAVDVLAEIHGLDTEAAGLEIGHPEGYVRRQVAGWTGRYLKAKTDEIADVERLAAWLEEHRPDESGAGLIHNDFKYDNLVLDPAAPTRVIAVLDWEMATRGDPLLDLGSSLAYWVEADDPPELQALRFCVTDQPGNLTREGVVERYREVTGRAPFDPVWYYAYGLFKLLVVAQQLYVRHVRGLTREPRYARMIDAVRGLAAVALRAIGWGRIGALSS